jgi:hypothetical protein
MAVFTVTAHAAEVRQDAKAIEMLKQMGAYKATLEQVAIVRRQLTAKS